MRKLTLALLCACMLAAVPAGQAWAENREEAKQLFESGLKLMRVDDFAAAAANFERSSALYPTQNSLFNLANCYKALQRYADALDVLRRLRTDFGNKLKPEIRDSVAQQETEIRSIVATLTLTVEPPSAKVVVDGRESPTSTGPRSLLLAPGDHTIEASLPGRRTAKRSVHMVSGAKRAESIVLEAEVGYLMVRSTPTGAAVWIDGAPRAKTPLAQDLALNPGNHVVTLHLAGRGPDERNVEIRAGERQTIEFALFDATSASASSMPESKTESSLALSTSPAASPDRGTRTWRIVAWSSAVGAALTGGAALIVWKVLADGHFSKAQTYHDQFEQNPSDQVAKKKGMAEFDLAVRDGHIALGLGIGAGVLAITSAISFLLDTPKKETTTVSLVPAGLRIGF